MTTATEAIAVLTNLGYTIIPPTIVLSGAGKEFYDMIKRKLENARDLTARHDAVYHAYDFVQSRYEMTDWKKIVSDIETIDTEIFTLIKSSRLF